MCLPTLYRENQFFFHYIQGMNRYKLDLLLPNCHQTNHHMVQCLQWLEETMNQCSQPTFLPEFQTESAKSSMVNKTHVHIVCMSWSLLELFTCTLYTYSDEDNNYLVLIHIIIILGVDLYPIPSLNVIRPALSPLNLAYCHLIATSNCSFSVLCYYHVC